MEAKQPWIIPLITTVVSAILSPIILSWLLRSERQRALKKDERIAEGTIHYQLIQSLQNQVSSLLTERGQIAAMHAELQTKYVALVDSGQNRRKGDLDQIELLERQLADTKGAMLANRNKMLTQYRHIEVLYELIERLRSDPSIIDSPEHLERHMNKVQRMSERYLNEMEDADNNALKERVHE